MAQEQLIALRAVALKLFGSDSITLKVFTACVSELIDRLNIFIKKPKQWN